MTPKLHGYEDDNETATLIAMHRYPTLSLNSLLHCLKATSKHPALHLHILS